MPSEHSFNSETVLTDEIRLESFYSEGSKMESQNDLNFNQFLMNGDIDSSPLLSPSTLGSSDISDVADVNDPFTKPTSAQLDFSGHLTPSHSGSNLASQLDNLGSIADRVSNHGNLSKEPSRLMVQIQDEVASISSYSSVSSPEILSPSHSGITSPSTFLNQDASTQLSLIQQAEDLNLHSDGTNLDSDNLWTILQDAEPTRKVLKTEEQTDTSSMTHGEDNVICTKPFDVGSAISSSQFVFKQFGQIVPGVLTITSTASASTNISGSNGAAITSAAITASSVPVSIRQPPRRLKTPSLALAFSAKQNGCELKILAQPEEQHRARYMTEGSRGSVKDTSGQAHPTVQLLGYKQKATLQVFVGSETGRVKPHGFYQACKVCGKNSTPCTERDIDGTTVIEMDFDPDEDMKLSIDCVGILKLRNADVEQRIGLAKSKKRSTKARLVFRVCLPKADGSTLTLQVASTQILCTQPIGQPEICKKSLKEAPVTGGDELFIIGKNFMKGTKVLFQEMANENSKEVIWEKAAEIDNEFFQQTHLICQVPEYDKCQTFVPVLVSVVVECSGRVSEAHSFTYTPVSIACGANTPCPSGTHTPVEAKMEIKREIIHIPMETEIEQPVSSSLSFVSPVALELNKLIQQGQQDGIFRIPAGVGLPASSTPDSSAMDTPLMSVSTSSSGMTAELRTISSMDISSTPEVSLPKSNISANSPMLASLLVKDPDTIHSPTLGPQSPAQGQQSPLGLQTPPDVSQFHQHDTLASAETQLSQLLQQSQQTSVVPQTPSEISQFLQDSPLGLLDSLSTETPERITSPQPPTDTSQFLQESSQTSTNVSQFLQQTSLSNQQASAGSFQTTPGISQFLQQISSTQTSAEVTFVQTQPQFVQVSMIGLPTQTMSSQSSDVSQFLQQMLLSQQNSNTSQQTAAVSGVPQFLQSSPAMNTLTFTVLSSSSPIMVQQTAPTMVQQRPTATMMQEQKSPVIQQQPDSSMMQQQASSMMQQHDSLMMQQQVPSPMMQQQASSAVMQHQVPSPVMQHQVPSPVMQQVASPITCESPETVQQASPETQSMSNIEQQASSTQSIEHASQTIDKLVSECQKEDSLQPNNGFMTSDQNSLPSISLDDVNDILKNDMS